MSWSDHVSFGTVCDLLEKVHKDQTKEKRKKRISTFFSQCRSYFKHEEDSLFPVIRLFLPQKDEERGAYGVKQNTLGRILIDMLQLASNDKDSQRLRNYTAPSSTASTDQGDFASVLYSIIKDRSYEGEAVSLTEVNSRLSELAGLKSSEKTKEMKRILLNIFCKMNACHLKWIVRIILKEMKLGLGMDTILGLIHPDAKELFNVNGSLRSVCQLLRNPIVRLNEIGITPFQPFKPMLAETGVLNKVVSQMNCKQFYIQTKFDGERMQAHFMNKRFKFFSRNGKDFTENFGDLPTSGKFCQYIARSLAPSVSSVILDGEICAYNHVTQSLVTKGTKHDIRHIQNDDSTYQQCFCIYDIVYLNGKVLTNLTLRQRLEILKTTVPNELKGRIQHTLSIPANSLGEVLDSLENAIKEREEGIVLKDPESVYKPNVRNKGGWVKVKPEYSNQLMDMPDLIIMGGFYAKGRRLVGTVSHFILGVAVKSSALGCPSEFRSLCRVGSGYSNKELFALLQKLEPNFKGGSPPNNLKMGTEKPDVWIDPQKSVIVKVKAAEIIKSSDYATGWTLRFPRVEEIRDDKSWSDCMTHQELKDLLQLTGGSLTRGPKGENFQDAATQSPVAKKARRNPPEKSVGVPLAYRATDISDVVLNTCELHDKVIVVEPSLNDNGNLKRRLERIAVKYGAIIEQNVTSGKTFCYVATMEKARAQLVIKSGYCNVVKTAWLLDCENRFHPLRPSYMLYTTPETQDEFSKRYDKFGDGYFDHTTEESLRFSLAKVEKVQATHAAIADFESEYLARNKYGLFRGNTFYFDRYSVIGNIETEIEFHPLILVEETARFYGGTVLTNPNDRGVSHVIVDESDKKRLKFFESIRSNGLVNFQLVSEAWINDSLANLKLSQETDFEVL